MSLMSTSLNPYAALACILEESSLLASTRLPLAKASQRILRECISAPSDLPLSDRVAKNGIAISWRDGAMSWYAAGQQTAGAAASQLLDPEGAIEVVSGAIRPRGTDTVIPYEYLEKLTGGWQLRAGSTLSKSHGIQRRGCDHRRGDVLLYPMTLLQAPELCLLAILGLSDVAVTSIPRVGLISKGGELVPWHTDPLPHQTRESNSLGAEICLRAHGFSEIVRYHACDDEADFEQVAGEAFATCDLVVISGGVSEGVRDTVPYALRRLGVREIFHQVGQAPGKGFYFGKAGNCLVFALPGQAIAAMMSLRRYVVPALAKLEGRSLPGLSLKLLDRSEADDRLELMLPCSLEFDHHGQMLGRICSTRHSADIASLRESRGFVALLPREQAYEPGEVVPYYPWAPL